MSIILLVIQWLRELETPNDKGSEKTILENFTTSNYALKSGKVFTSVVGNMKLSWVDSVLDTLD